MEEDKNQIDNNSKSVNIDKEEVFIPNNTETNDNNSSVNSIFLNSDDEDEIAITQKEFVPEHQRLYDDDEVYYQDLENYFLSELSLDDQNSIYKQKRIVETIEDILRLKNEAIEDIKKPLNKNPFVFHFSHNNFNSPYLIPIVLDRKREYVNMDHDEIEAAGNKEFKVLTDVDSNYDKLLEVKRQFRYGEINLTTYYRLIIDLSLPFLPKEELDGNKVGYNTVLEKSSNVLRLDNIHNKDWKIRRSEPKASTNHLYFEENKVVPTVVEDVIFEGENTNIIGFLLLPFGKDNITKNLEGKSHLAKSGIVGEITEITKSDNAVVTLPDHGLSNGDNVFIEKTNSTPNVDGLHENITIIDEDRFMVRINTSKGRGGDKGIVYSSLPINMTEVDISKYDKINKNNKLNKFPVKEARFYRIDREILSEDDYHDILEKALPSVFEILNTIPLDKINSMEDVKSLLQPFNINPSNLFIDYYKPIHETFQNRIKTLREEKIDETDFYLKNYKSYLDKKGVNLTERKELIEKSIYRDDFLKHPTISKYYGIYSPINDAEDNILARYLWVSRKIDKGELFFSFVKIQLTKINSLDKNHIDHIEDELSILDKKNKNIVKKIEDENKKNKTSGLCNNKKGLVIFKTMGELEASQKIDAYKEGDFALVEINSIPSKQPIYFWSSQYNKWIINRFISNYSDYCNFGTLTIKNFDFKQVLCMDYENQCKLVQQIRLERTKKEIENIKEEYEEAGKYYQRKSNLSLLEKEFEASILRIQILQKRYESAFEHENNDEEKSDVKFIKSPIQELLGYIDNLMDEEDIMELKFKLLQKDGLLIDKKIYSKTFKTELLCGHYQYLYDISRNINTPKAETLRNQMISVYGDSGKANPGFITCQYCGEILMRDEYDTNEGISKVTGEIRKSRDILQSDKQKYARRQEILSTEVKNLDYFQFDCTSNEYRNELIQKGLNLSQLPIAIDLCLILNSLLQKLNTLLRKNDFLQIIINVIQKLGSIPEYQRWRKDKLDKLQIKNPGIDFSRINEKVLEDEYKVQIRKKKIIFVSASLLIILQTAIPPYDIRATILSFSGIDGDEGITFMAKLLEKSGMATIQTPLQKERKIQKVLEEDEIREEIIKALNIFRLMPDIRKRYDEKRKYVNESSKSKKISPELGVMSGRYPEVNKLPDDIYASLNKNKEGELYSTSVYILDRLNYLGQKSIDDIYKYVENNEKLYPSEISSSCCIQPLSLTTNYDTPIIEETNNEFADNLDEINRGYEYLYDIRKKLMPPWFKNKPKYTFYCGDLVSLRFFRNTNLEHKRFGYYLKNGEKDKFDSQGRSLNSGKTKNELLNETHTEEEYRELIHNIVKHTYRKVVEFKPYVKINLEEIITRSQDYLENEIHTFVKKLDSYLNQKPDSEFINKRINFLKNIGILSKKEKEENDYLVESNVKAVEKYIAKNQFEFERAQRIINIINFKFRKNISRVSNNFRRIEKPIDGMTEEAQKNLNIYINNQDDFINTYMTRLNSVLFKLVKWEYTPSEIESILGKPPRMTEDTGIENDSKHVSMNGAITILQYTLVIQLNDMLDIDFESASLYDLDKTEIPNQLDLYGKTNMAQFIETIFREIEKENNQFDFTKNQFNQYKRAIYNIYFEKEAVKFNEMTEGQKMLYKLGFDYKDISAKEMEEIEKMNNSIGYQAQEKEDFYIMKAKEIYTNEYGEEPTNAQLEDIKDKLKHKDKYDNQEDDDFGKTGISGGDYGDLDTNIFGEDDEPIIDENAYIEEEAQI